MWIDRIAKIHDYGTFREFSWPKDLTDFGRYNLIYGWNGSGKTLLSNIFRGLERRENIANGQVALRVDGRNISGDCFSGEQVPIRVFNRNFVNDAVFPPDKNIAHILVVGPENVEMQKQADKLETELRVAATEFSGLERARNKAHQALDLFCIARADHIRGDLRFHGSNPYNNYDKSNFRRKAQELEKAAEPSSLILDEDEKTRLLKQHAASPKERVPAVAYNFPDLGELSRTVYDMLAQTVVTSTIAALEKDPDLATWVRDGLDKHKQRHAECCLFCGQKLPNKLLQNLETHFNDEYENFLKRINKKIEEINSLLALAENPGLPHKAELYDDLADQYEKAAKAFQKQLDRAKNALLGIQEALTLKKDRIFESSVLETFVPALQIETVDGVNKIIGRHNKACDEFAERVRSARKELEAAFVAEALPEFKTLKGEFQQKEGRLTAKKDATERQQADLDRLTSDLLGSRLPVERLNRDLRAYLGHGEIWLATKKTGYQIFRSGEVAKDLSEGETTAIALLYFLQRLKDHRFSLSNGIVVLDDPVCSLDSNFIYSAFGFMKERTKNAGQLFILTHNFTLFRQVRRWFSYLKREMKKGGGGRYPQFYMLNCNINIREHIRCSDICQLDSLLKDYESEYHYLFSRVYHMAKANASDNLGVRYSMPNIARRLLEAFLSFRVPDKRHSLWTQLKAIKYDEPTKNRIYQFVNVYSHHGQIGEEGDDLSVLSETQSVLGDLLKLIEDVDQPHFLAMKSLVSSGGST